MSRDPFDWKWNKVVFSLEALRSIPTITITHSICVDTIICIVHIISCGIRERTGLTEGSVSEGDKNASYRSLCES